MIYAEYDATRHHQRFFTPEKVSFLLGMVTLVCVYILGYMTRDNIVKWLGDEPVRFVSPVPYEK